MRRCTVSIRGKDGELHSKTVDATSLFDAADETMRDLEPALVVVFEFIDSDRIWRRSLASESGNREKMARAEESTPQPGQSKGCEGREREDAALTFERCHTRFDLVIIGDPVDELQ